MPVIEAAAKADTFFITSRIRVDTDLDKAILEIRSSDTGDVIRQYPTESQIRAFQRASELDAQKQAAASVDKASDTAERAGYQPSAATTFVSTPSEAPAAEPAPIAAATVSSPESSGAPVPSPATNAAAPQSVLV